MTKEPTSTALRDGRRLSSSGAGHVLVIDDDEELCELLSLRIESQGYLVTTVTSAKGGLALLGTSKVDTVLLDLRLSDGDGMDVLREIKARSPDLPVIVLTAHGTIETAVEAVRTGAYGFITKPFLDHDLLQKLAHAVESSALRREVAGLRHLVGQESGDRVLVGVSPAMAKVREVIARVASSEATVLVLGESGTGKELAARSLHAASPRAKGPFVAVNCAALAPELLESALFGHTRGAFTGATADREGLFGAARRGTLFLDEIGEASPAVQAKLLRVLQERRYTRVGSNAEEEADVRIVAATNRDLRAEVNERRFREDLFYRLHVVPIQLPALRDRPEDVPILAELFLERAAARHGLTCPSLTEDARRALASHPWPGNVRELANVVEAALLLSGGTTVGPDCLPGVGGRVGEALGAEGAAFGTGSLTGAPAADVGSLFADPSKPVPTLKEARDAFERAYLVAILERCGGNVTQAARVAGRNRSDFYDLLRRHGVSAAAYKRFAS